MIMVTQENLCIQKIDNNMMFLNFFFKIQNIRIHLKMCYYLQTEFCFTHLTAAMQKIVDARHIYIFAISLEIPVYRN